jgi:hypothetical protein
VEAPGGGSWNVPNWGNSGLHNKPAGCGASEAYASGPGSVNVNVLLTATYVAQQNRGNLLLRFHGNNGYENLPQG